MKRLIDTLGYKGPVAVAGDCTKVRARLTYSNDMGSHILGSVLDLSETAVKSTDDIEKITTRILKEKKLATQTRAILVKVHTIVVHQA